MAQQPTINDLFNDLLALRDEWASLCTNPKLRFEKEVEWVIQSCEKSDTARKYALGDFEAVRAALRNIAGVGVTIDPARKLAYVMPRDSKMVYDLSYMGLIDIAVDSGSIRWAQARRVFTNDKFELSGFDAPPVHKCNPFAKPEERGEVLGSYVVVKTADGDYLTNTMHIAEINAIRDRSPAWKAGKGPWKTDPAEMQKKTVVKNAYKYWPRSERLDKAVHYLNTDGGQGIDLDGQDSTGKLVIEELLAELAACTSGTAVATCWTKGRERLKEYPEETATFREAVAKRNRELGVAPPAKNGTAPGAVDAPAATPAPTAGPRTCAQIVDLIKAAETDADLEATGPMIDALPEDQQGGANTIYNDRLRYLNDKFGRPNE
jgi:recombination protein RecT